MSETVITHALVYSSLPVSPGLLLRDLKMFTYLNLLLREMKHSQMPMNDIGMCVLIQHCLYTSAVIYLFTYVLHFSPFHAGMLYMLSFPSPHFPL